MSRKWLAIGLDRSAGAARLVLHCCALWGCGDPLLATVGFTTADEEDGGTQALDSGLPNDVGFARDTGTEESHSDADTEPSLLDAELASSCVPLPDLNHLRSLNDAGKAEHFDVEGGVRVSVEPYHGCDGGAQSGDLIYSLVSGEPIVRAGTQHWLRTSKGFNALSFWVGTYQSACERPSPLLNAELVANGGAGACNQFKVNKDASYLRLSGGMLTVQLGSVLELCAQACP